MTREIAYSVLRKLSHVVAERGRDLLDELLRKVSPEHLQVLRLDDEHVSVGPFQLVHLVDCVEQALARCLHRCN